MVVLNVKPTIHSLELLSVPQDDKRLYVCICSCGWDSRVASNDVVRERGRTHLREDRTMAFIGFWRQFFPASGEQRGQLMRPGPKTYRQWFREPDGSG
jgi:hypothetical protein